MSKEEIEKQIMDEYVKFENAIHDGPIPVPDNIITLFQAGCMAQAAHFHKVHANKIKAISSKHASELTNGDLNCAAMIIVNTPMEKLYPYPLTFDDAVSQQIKLEKFILSFNNYISEYQKKLEMKKVTLTSLAQTGPGPNKLRMI